MVNVTLLDGPLFQILPADPIKFPTPMLCPLRLRTPPFTVNCPLADPSALLVFNWSRPEETVVPPVYELLPDNTQVPPPLLVKLVAPVLSPILADRVLIHVFDPVRFRVWA